MRLNDIGTDPSDEMKHADKYIERILFSKVSLICRISANLASIEDVEEMRSDLSWSWKGANLREAIAYADASMTTSRRDMMIEIWRMKKAISTGWKPNSI